MTEDENNRYYIERMFSGGTPNKRIKSGLTLEQAQAHCRRKDTSGTLASGEKWFDGYSLQRKAR
jgi:hypothetical protein